MWSYCWLDDILIILIRAMPFNCECCGYGQVSINGSFCSTIGILLTYVFIPSSVILLNWAETLPSRPEIYSSQTVNFGTTKNKSTFEEAIEIPNNWRNLDQPRPIFIANITVSFVDLVTPVDSMTYSFMVRIKCRLLCTWSAINYYGLEGMGFYFYGIWPYNVSSING